MANIAKLIDWFTLMKNIARGLPIGAKIRTYYHGLCPAGTARRSYVFGVVSESREVKGCLGCF
jgi:hypothetical protein